MAFAIVKWQVDGRFSIIPAKNIVKPDVIETNNLPTDGECRWGGGKYKARILQVSGKVILLKAIVCQLSLSLLSMQYCCMTMSLCYLLCYAAPHPLPLAPVVVRLAISV